MDFSIPENRLAKRVNHWQQVAISASEQCGRVKSAPGHIASAVGKLGEDHGSRGTMGTALHGCRNATAPSTADSVPSDAALLIGLEGGLTNEEVAIAIEHGFSPLQLGTNIANRDDTCCCAHGVEHSVGRNTQLSTLPSPNTRRALVSRNRCRTLSSRPRASSPVSALAGVIIG